MTLDEMYAEIDALPGENGWRHRSNGETFRDLAKRMYSAGCMPELVVEVLVSAYSAAADESGS